MKAFVVFMCVLISVAFATIEKRIDLSYFKTMFYINEDKNSFDIESYNLKNNINKSRDSVVIESYLSKDGIMQSCKITMLNCTIILTEEDIKKLSEVTVYHFNIKYGYDFMEDEHMYSIFLGHLTDSTKKSGAIRLYLDSTYKVVPHEDEQKVIVDSSKVNIDNKISFEEFVSALNKLGEKIEENKMKRKQRPFDCPQR